MSRLAETRHSLYAPHVLFGRRPNGSRLLDRQVAVPNSAPDGNPTPEWPSISEPKQTGATGNHDPLWSLVSHGHHWVAMLQLCICI